jgi:hypothetical protein
MKIQCGLREVKAVADNSEMNGVSYKESNKQDARRVFGRQEHAGSRARARPLAPDRIRHKLIRNQSFELVTRLARICIKYSDFIFVGCIMTMILTKSEGKAVPASNVRDLQQERQRRAARRMAMQTIVLQRAYLYVWRVVSYA